MSTNNEHGEIVVYQSKNGLSRVDVRFEDESVWLSKAQMAELYQRDRSVITRHIQNIFREGELDENSNVHFLHIANSDKPVAFYSLEVIIAVGYRIKSSVGTQFRQWATALLKEYMQKGFTLDDERLKGTGGGDYWKELLARIQDIRSSEKMLYRQVLDLYATSTDYDPHSDESKRFFRIVQNKLHYAAHGHTAAEVIFQRADAEQPFMGLRTFKGDVVGDVSEADMRRVQIRETIISHLEKEAQLFAQGIKCLSLFFIDEVAKYRQYDADGMEALGEYGRVFEEEYDAVVNDYRTLFDPAYLAYLDSIDTHETHRGYFSIDKKTGRAVDSKPKRGSEFSDDISAYDLILKNKERLLSFEEPTRFIFSHSALREGWDNPNVFQICTLKHGGDSSTQKRQEVGRGLRLCVNQAGDRMDAETVGDQVHVLNTLTVIASEGYASFVKALQEQTREVLYDRPRKASIEYFEGKNIITSDGQKITVTPAQARQVYQYLVKNNYIDEDDNVTQDYRDDVQTDSLRPLPEALRPMQEGIHKLVQAIFDDKVLADMFKDANKTPAPENPLNDRFYKEAFQTLWRAINHKYAYQVDFDSDELIQKSIAAIDAVLYLLTVL